MEPNPVNLIRLNLIIYKPNILLQTPELQKKIVKTQDSMSNKTTPSREQKTRHRRMSSVGQAALLADLMHVAIEQDPETSPPPVLDRKVIGIPTIID